MTKLRFFYIVTVNNPSSTILANNRRERIVTIAETLSEKKGRLLPVLFDKAYEDIIHDETVEKPVSGLKCENTHLTFEIGTFSKAIAPALRIGYMLTRNRDLANLIIQKISDIGFSAPLMNQEITAWILDHYMNEQLRKVNEGYRIKANQTKTFLTDELGGNLIDIRGGSGGFYFYLTLLVETHRESGFYRYLSRTTGNTEIDGYPEKKPRLIYIPGTCCVSPHGAMKEIGKKQLRISYGFETMEQIKKAVILIREAIDYSK
jgi:DNA-binding transcriptional MocR family regulator